MSYAEYDAIDAMNWSKLRLLRTSPKLLKWREQVERADTEALVLGRAIHCALLEPDRWKSDFLVEPKFDKRTKAGKADRAIWLATQLHGAYIAQPSFKLNTKVGKARQQDFLASLPEGVTVLTGDENAAELLQGKTIVDADTHALAERCAESIRNHPRAAELFEGARHEEVVTWTDQDTGVRCKARLDTIKPAYLVDLKSTRRTSLRQMGADLASYLYHGQAAFYSDGAIANKLIPADSMPRICFVQTVEPFDVVPGWLSAWDLNSGRELYRSLLRKYLDCQTADLWPGLAPELIEIPTPDWIAGSIDNDNEEDW